MKKNQTKCYRTFKGHRYENLCDVMDDIDFNLVKKVKLLNLRHRVVKHSEGFGQLFVHVDDINILFEG